MYIAALGPWPIGEEIASREPSRDYNDCDRASLDFAH
jgi:hypothetical protein